MASSTEAQWGGPTLASPRIATLLVVAVAVVTRIVAWWNPVAHVDDQFYLLAGEELLNGRWPYVDVWDRKPLGLFLLYAGIAWIGGGTILGLNLIATAFAAATAMIIRQIALRFASSTSATLAALSYLISMPVFGGQTGQSPVFYNLLVAGAALLLMRATDRVGITPVRRLALAAMLLAGLAMTIKQISVVEGAWFGLAFLWLLRRLGASWAEMAASAAAMAFTALLPTALMMGGYALAGEAALREFFYANFVSIFDRGGFQLQAKLAGAAYFLLYLLPLLGMGGWGAFSRWRKDRHDARTLILLGWMGAALLGYLLVPAFFDHYALPVLVPFSVAAGIAFDRPARWLLFMGLTAFYLIDGAVTDLAGNRRDARQFQQISDSVRAAGRGGCVYVVDGPSRLYSEFPQCRATRYLFSDHLVLITEANAVGVNTAAELARILSEKPEVLVTRPAPKGGRLPEIESLVRDRLDRDYRLILSLPKSYNPSIDQVTRLATKGPRFTQSLTLLLP